MKYVLSYNYLCFEALIEMIVSDIKPELRFSQTDFAELFGVTVPNGEMTPIKNVSYSSTESEFGTKPCIEDINSFFCNNQVPLRVAFVNSNLCNEMTFSTYIVNESKKAYIMFAFCYGMLYDEPLNKDIGHVSLLEEVDEKSDMIKIYDPGPRNPGSKKVKIDDMLYAMRRRGGMYVFEKTIV